jgi:small nuclear ribonucleoprotein (snRNP)-like protein
MNTFQMDAYEIARFIKESKKKTPVKLYIKGENLLSILMDHLNTSVTIT